MRKKKRTKGIIRRSDCGSYSICLLEQLCFNTVFTVPSFGILGDFRSFRLLGFRGIFRHSVF